MGGRGHSLRIFPVLLYEASHLFPVLLYKEVLYHNDDDNQALFCRMMPFPKHEKLFLSAASASVFVPHSTRASIAEVFPEDAGQDTLQELRQRDILFFDERLALYLVLHIPQCSEEDLRSYLARLELKIEVWAAHDTHPSEHNPTTPNTPRDLLFTAVVEHNEDPIVLISQNEDDEKIFLNLVWEVEAILNRPQLRLQDVNLTFVPVALLSPVEEPKQDEIYLEPFKPQARNLFEPLRGTRGFEEHVPYLPISRLRSMPPVGPKDDHTFHIRAIRSQPFPTYLAFATKLKFSKSPADTPSMLLIAALEIDLIPSVEIKGQIETVQATLQNGVVKAYMNDMLPMECQSRDSICFLYRLEEGKEPENSFDFSRSVHLDTLDVTIQLRLKISEDCQPQIRVYWTTDVDYMQFERHTPNLQGISSQQPIAYRNQSIDGRIYEQPHSLTAATQPESHAAGQGMVTISFAANTKPVKVGVPFTWQVLVVNRTSKATKLAIIPLPRVQKPTSQVQQYARKHATRSSVASMQASERSVGDRAGSDIAQAVMDENVVYAVQHSGAVPPETDLMSLTPELRIGPLGPGQCHEGEIKLIAFKSGAFTFDAIRVVDLVREIEQGYGSPGVVMDIRDLPDVVVQESSSEER